MPIRVKTAVVMLLASSVVSTAFAADTELTTLEQKFSYTMGYTFAQQMQGQLIKVDKAAVISAVEDVFASKDPRLPRDEMQKAMEQVRAKIDQLRKERATRTYEEGKKFLDENRKREGVTVLSNGIQYRELAKGSGETPSKQATVTVNYTGTHINGTVFDSSSRHGGPAKFNLGRVIPGFREVISLMQNGSKWEVVIPSDMGYGSAGAPPDIGPNETLIFEIELISFENPPKS